MSRSPFVEISRLPKLDKNIRSINFRRTTPGSIYPIIHANKPPPPHQALDPTHPALSYLPADYIRAFPWRTCDGFKLRALPHALLQQPSPRHPSPPYQLHTGPTRGERRVNMSLLNIAPRNIGGHVAREQVFRKFKTAISLIATRGAYVEGSGDAAKVVFGDDNDPFDWILTGWVYVIRPEERVYSMPYQHLIPALRDVLRVTAVTGRRLEKEWAKMKESRCAPQSSRTLTLPSSEPPFPSADGKMRATRLLRALREAFADDSATSSTKSREQSTWAEIFSRHSTPASEVLPGLVIVTNNALTLRKPDRALVGPHRMDALESLDGTFNPELASHFLSFSCVIFAMNKSATIVCSLRSSFAEQALAPQLPLG